MKPGWLTMHEVLEETGLTYQHLVALTETGVLRSEASGAAILYDPDDVDRLIRSRTEQAAG